MFLDQFGEFSELQRELGATQAKLQQMEALLTSLPPPRGQVRPLGTPQLLWLCHFCRVGLPHPSEPLSTSTFQKEACVAARVWREFEKKRAVSGDSALWPLAWSWAGTL